jgi:hypothetical protein
MFLTGISEIDRYILSNLDLPTVISLTETCKLLKNQIYKSFTEKEKRACASICNGVLNLLQNDKSIRILVYSLIPQMIRSRYEDGHSDEAVILFNMKEIDLLREFFKEGYFFPDNAKTLLFIRCNYIDISDIAKLTDYFNLVPGCNKNKDLMHDIMFDIREHFYDDYIEPDETRPDSVIGILELFEAVITAAVRSDNIYIQKELSSDWLDYKPHYLEYASDYKIGYQEELDEKFWKLIDGIDGIIDNTKK